jgi:hypothetical protein
MITTEKSISIHLISGDSNLNYHSFIQVFFKDYKPGILIIKVDVTRILVRELGE